MSNTEQKNCPQCGKPLPADAPSGLCPNCVMAMNLSPATRMNSADYHGSQAMPPSPEEIADWFPNFEVLECLGRGGMGVVYKARQKTLDREVAIKVLAGEWEGDAAFAERFEREAKILAQMSHPSIVTIHDFGQANGLYYIVMEYVDGVNLREFLSDGKMAPEQALAIVPPICEALEYAHSKGVIHRDIKPENLLLDRDGRVKIADFGIASLVGVTTDISGTPSYMAPEQANGCVDRRADIYALGVVLYEMLTGERPANEVVAPSKKVEVDVKIDEMVLRALEREPEQRYQTARQFQTTVEFVAGSSESGEKTSGVSRNLQRNRLRGSPSGHTRRSLLSNWKFGLAIGSTVAVAAFGAFAAGNYLAPWGDLARNLGAPKALLTTELDAGRESVKIRNVQVQKEPAAIDATKQSHRDRIIIEDLALHLIVAVREKDDQKLESLATNQIKGWSKSLPVFAVELRELYRQLMGDEKFDLRATKSMVNDNLGVVRCTGPHELKGKCLILMFVKGPDGWKNCLLRSSTEEVKLKEHLTHLKKQLDRARARRAEASNEAANDGG